jgi:hypothetical protein
VIRIDFAGGTIETRDQFDQTVYRIFEHNQRYLNLDCELLSQRNDPAGCFERLIQKAHEHYGQKVVILIDEYDKPILDQITHIELANQIREGLKNLYSVMKAQDEHIQFILMTGVTKFSKVSLFSGINQIRDITLDRRYATICGYTQHDLETIFAEHLAGVDWDKLKRWYNGYNFLGEAVYNPYDILLFIDSQHTYLSHWFETGSPTFLLKLFKQEHYFLPELEDIEVGEEILNSFEIENINPITLLFQSGYLTIERAWVDEFEEMIFRLKIPNKEVQSALNIHFIATYTKIKNQSKHLRQGLYHCLIAADLTLLEKQIISLFSSIPWRNFTQNDIDQFEGYYASVLYAFIASMDVMIIPEDINNQGQADLTVMIGDYIYIMEIKRDTSQVYDTSKPNSALQQIIDNQYAQKYLAQQAQGKTIIQLGLVFNTHARNLVAFDARQSS